jgi:sugar phosphate isomerase/epimerase
MRALGLHNLAAIEVDPVAFVSIAAETGCQEISVFVHLPNTRASFPVVTPENWRAVDAGLRQTGLKLANVETFMIAPNTDLAAFRPALERGAALGARRAVTQIFDPEERRAVDTLGRLCEMAASLDLGVGLEFMALSPACDSIGRAEHFVRQVARPNLGIAVDALHLVRSGGSPADVAAVEPGLIAYAQLCDGTDLTVTRDYVQEAIGDRLAPGDGRFPLKALIEALPAAIPLELEVPQPQDRPPLERARHIVASARRLIETAKPTR